MAAGKPVLTGKICSGTNLVKECTAPDALGLHRSQGAKAVGSKMGKQFNEYGAHEGAPHGSADASHAWGY
jgi:hypothetical protein